MRKRIDGIYNFLSIHSLAVSLIVTTLLFVAFYPIRYANIDEHDYYRNAELLGRGVLRQECVENEPSQFHVEDYCISKYNLGTSLFLLPAAVVNSPQLAFTIIWLVFAFGIVIFHKTLQLHKVDTIFTYLFAFYPAFTYYSRTLFSETFSATLVLTVFYLLLRYQQSGERRHGMLVGLAAGAAVLVRYTNVLPLGVLIVGMLLTSGNRKVSGQLVKKILSIATGSLPFLIIFLLVNTYLYGQPFRSGYYYSGEEGLWNFAQMPSMLMRFAGVLLMLYPGMLLAPILVRAREAIVITIASLATIIFYSAFPNTMFEGRLLDFILGIRFLVPIIPLPLVCYTIVLNRFREHFLFRPTTTVVITALIFLSVALSIVHQNFLLN